MTAAAGALVARPITARPLASVEAGSPFQHGVASGDPDHDSLVIWTRLSGLSGVHTVNWELSDREDFTSLLSHGTTRTGPERDHTVKVVVTGLEAGRSYFYRFTYQGHRSVTGTTRTLPRGDIDSLTIAVASCSNYAFGFFNAYEAIARDPSIEWVLHLGDYLYEHGRDGFGRDVGRLFGREHEPPHEIVSLADYRQRHAQYKADAQSQLMHAAQPLLAIWDDHEVTNNPWMDGAQNHQNESEGDWSQRRRAALRAYFEWMPVRDPAPGHRRRDYWRHWRFGNLASLTTLETRHSGRARQIEYADHRESLQDPDSAQVFLRDVVGAPRRPMLSTPMEDFLRQSLEETVTAQRPWRMIANQIPMARTLNPVLDDALVAKLSLGLEASSRRRLDLITRMGRLGLPLYLDPWDGYPVARERFYGLCRKAGVSDLLVLTGDSHSFWSNRLFDQQGQSVGVELGTTGITSPGDFLEFGVDGAARLDEQLVATNPEVVWTEGRYTGYVKLTLTAQHGEAEYLACSTTPSPDALSRTIRRIPLLRNNDMLQLGDPIT